MNILIIGGTGVLSSAVVAEATRKGIEVTMVNRGKRVVPNGVSHIQADKRDLRKISEAIKSKSFDAVLDFLLQTPEDTKESVEFYTQYTKHYFFISSCAVYNTAAFMGQIGNEDSPKVLQEYAYSVNKWACEQMVVKLFAERNAHYTIIRPCTTYGDTRIPYGISPRFGFHWTLVARVLHDKPIITWNEGNNRSNLTRVEDFAVGVVGLIGNPKAYNNAFNVCGDEQPKQSDVLESIALAVDHPVRKVDIDISFYANEIPHRKGELVAGCAIDCLNSNTKIKDAVPDFKPKYYLKEGVKMTIDAIRQQSYQHGIDWKFDAETDRTIRKWCTKKGIKMDRGATSFKDYLGTATLTDRIYYWCVYYRLEKYYNWINHLLKTVSR